MSTQPGTTLNNLARELRVYFDWLDELRSSCEGEYKEEARQEVAKLEQKLRDMSGWTRSRT